MWDAIKAAWESVLKPVFQAIGDFVTNILWPAIQVAFQLIQNIVEAVFQFIQGLWTNILQPVFQAIGDFVTTVLWPAIQTAFQGIQTVVSTVFSAIQGFWNSILKPVFDAIGTAASALYNNFILPQFQAIQTIVSTVFNAIKGFWDSILKPVFTAVGDAAKAMFEAVKKPLDNIKEKVEKVFNGIKSFLSPIVDWLKGIFNFKWELPKIKLPHFHITGKFSLNPPSAPHFSIDWYAKAMDEPFMLSNPTIFGAGEAGDEVIYGHRQLMSDIKDAVGAGGANNTVTVNVYPSAGMNEEDLAQRVADLIDRQVNQRTAVFA